MIKFRFSNFFLMLVFRKFDVKPQKIFHVSVMPCFDKKLEAARPHSENLAEYREVDCVLSTGTSY